MVFLDSFQPCKNILVPTVSSSEIARSHGCHKRNDENGKTPSGKNQRQSHRPHPDDVDGTSKGTKNSKKY